MDGHESSRPSAHRPARDVAEKLDRDESAFETAEGRLGAELYDNTARLDDAVDAGLAERDAARDRTKERLSATADRGREGAARAFADLGPRRQAAAEEPKDEADAAPDRKATT